MGHRRHDAFGGLGGERLWLRPQRTETEDANRSKHAQREQLAAKQAAQVTLATNRANACEEKNGRMYKLRHELVQRCEKWGLGDTLMSPFEPFTGLRRVKLENLSQEFEDKLLDEKVQP